jgi:dCTP deaminase
VRRTPIAARKTKIRPSLNGNQYGILVDHQIIKAQKRGIIRIDPFSSDLVEPATYDLRVGDRAVISTTSKVIDMQNARLLVIEPGAMAILQSLEMIELSRRVAGRVGPKSSLLRRGVFVAVGPQIDPGFKGRMIVNLINLSPRPFSLHHQDRFLTAEFHLLASEPTKGYKGPYQGRTELSTEEIEGLLAYQGPTLADLHRGFAEIRDNIREVAALGREIPRLIDVQERGIGQMVGVQSRMNAVTQPIGPGLLVPITTFAPEPYDLIRQMVAVVQPSEEGFIAGVFDANVHASGDTEEEAVRNLKSLILDVFDSLSAEPPERLGPQPSRQLAALREFIANRA